MNELTGESKQPPCSPHILPEAHANSEASPNPSPHPARGACNFWLRGGGGRIVVLALKTAMVESVVTGQAPVTLEWKLSPAVSLLSASSVLV